MIDFEYFFKGVGIALKYIVNSNRKDKVMEAQRLAKEQMYQDALDILENADLSPNNKTAVNLLGYMVKAICYAALGYKQSARNSVNVILNMDRLSLSINYQIVLSDAKKLAKEIEEKL